MKLDDIITKQYGLSKLPKETSYAMAYVPFQPENAAIYSPDQGFCVGTMHPALDKPFYGAKCGDGND